MPLQGEYEPVRSARSRNQAELFERTAGAQGDTLRGRPVIVLTYVGARTGKVRKIPLMRVEHEGRYAVVASKGGAPAHPLWYHGVVAHPRVELQDGPVRRDYAVRELAGAERDEWWARAVETWPDYAQYQARTDRLIPVLLLTPVED